VSRKKKGSTSKKKVPYKKKEAFIRWGDDTSDRRGEKRKAPFIPYSDALTHKKKGLRKRSV